MILINLLPSEMRKKQGNSNPLVYAIAACYLVALVPVGTWAWLKYSRLPEAIATLDQRNEELTQKTSEAEAVEAMRGQIAEFETHRDSIVNLLSRKVYWARALDEFANHLNGPGGTPWQGFDVSCTDLTITPMGSGGGRKDDRVSVGFRGRYKLVGLERDKAGDYVRDFFLTTENSKFWAATGFQGKPELTYRGDTPDWKKELSRVTVEFTLDWVRVKTIATNKSAERM